MDSKMLNKKLAKRLKQLREERGLTLEKLAYENGLAKGNLSEIEKGKVDPKLSTLGRIAEGLGISLKDLITF